MNDPIFHILNNAFEFLISYVYFSAFFQRKAVSLRKGGMILLIFIFYSYMNISFASPIFNLIVALFSHGALQYLLFSGNWKWRGISLIGYAALSILVELIAVMIVQSFMQQISPHIFLIWIGFIRTLAVLLLRATVQNIGEEIDKYAVGGYMIYSILIVLYVVFIAEQSMETKEISVSMIAAVILLMGILLMYYFIRVSGQRMELRREIERLRIDRAANQIVVNEILSREEELRAIRHDLKNFDIGLLSADEEERERRLKERIKLIDDINKNTYSNNPVAQTIFHLKLQKLEILDQHCEINLNIPSDLSIDNVDLSIILGNALDNCVEALSKFPLEARVLRIDARYNNRGLVMRLENTFHPMEKKG